MRKVMQGFSSDITGFAALTIVEFLIQELVIKGVLDKEEVERLLEGAANRHDHAAKGDLETIGLNIETARLIRALSEGLQPLFQQS